MAVSFFLNPEKGVVLQAQTIEITANVATQALEAMRQAGKGQARRTALMEFVKNWFGLNPEQTDLIHGYMSAIGKDLAKRKNRRRASRSGDS